MSLGDTLTSTELLDVFFGVTKLFQSADNGLRRMVYLFIKEVADSCNPDDVIIVTSSLTKDMNGDVDLYRSNSIRVLARIVDAAMLGAIERYMKQVRRERGGEEGRGGERGTKERRNETERGTASSLHPPPPVRFACLTATLSLPGGQQSSKALETPSPE